ncbi:MAG: hypothetical protein KGJ24_15880, partial [Burkholderiales bacterium]|nr:hypothetical protein [Burkholderiales bacterium]
MLAAVLAAHGWLLSALPRKPAPVPGPGRDAGPVLHVRALAPPAAAPAPLAALPRWPVPAH